MAPKISIKRRMSIARSRKATEKRKHMDDSQWSAVSLRDVLYLRKVRNGQNVRNEAGDLPKIGLIEHLLWYARNVNWIHQHSFIVYKESRRAGYIRLAPITSGAAEISIALEPWAQGQGLGSRSLRWAVENYARISGLERITARIDRENSRSIAAFSGAGFVRLEEVIPGETLLFSRFLDGQPG